MWPVIINGVGICYVKCLCVLSCDLIPVVEIWIILTGMFRTFHKSATPSGKSPPPPYTHTQGEQASWLGCWQIGYMDSVHSLMWSKV